MCVLVLSVSKFLRNITPAISKGNLGSISSWRTLAYEEVRLQIGPLTKLGRFKSTADNFLVYIVTISLVSGPIRSLTSWYAEVLHDFINNLKCIFYVHRS